ncbi:hypothetical protein WJX84_011677 [Apatococcus fuscideae]|uniref:Uncharacterized protein n=1 Tax=Apatococcus fuscideae TaxID=2026836 RepID=A0AAW1TJ79_9CHLO
MGHACISIRTLRCGFLTSAEQLGYQANAGITSTQWMLRRMHKTQMLSQKRPDNPQRQALGNQAATLLMYWSGIWWSRFVGVCDSKCQPHVWQTDDKHKLNFREYSLSVTDALQQMLLKQVIRDRRREARQHLVQAQGRTRIATRYIFQDVTLRWKWQKSGSKRKQRCIRSSSRKPCKACTHPGPQILTQMSLLQLEVPSVLRLSHLTAGGRQGSSGPAPQAPECAGRIGIHDNISIAIEVGRRHSYTAARKAACSSQGRWEQDKRRQDSHCQRQATRASPAVVIVARTEDTWREITSIFQSLSCLAYLAFGANSCHIEQGLLPL